MKHNYTVIVERAVTNEFLVEDANTPEEAVSIVEQWIEDGELGTQVDSEVLDMDAIEGEEEEKFN